MKHPSKTRIGKPISLAPLRLEDAVKAALATGKAPPLPKRKPKAKP